MTTSIITSTMFLPDGLDAGHADARSFAVTVEWRGVPTENGRGGYRVQHLGRDLSRAGNWGWPEPFQQHQYRWETYEEAVAQAEAVVNNVKVYDKTYAEWQEIRKND